MYPSYILVWIDSLCRLPVCFCVDSGKEYSETKSTMSVSFPQTRTLKEYKVKEEAVR